MPDAQLPVGCSPALPTAGHPHLLRRSLGAQSACVGGGVGAACARAGVSEKAESVPATPGQQHPHKAALIATCLRMQNEKCYGTTRPADVSWVGGRLLRWLAVSAAWQTLTAGTANRLLPPLQSKTTKQIPHPATQSHPPVHTTTDTRTLSFVNADPARVRARPSRARRDDGQADGLLLPPNGWHQRTAAPLHVRPRRNGGSPGGRPSGGRRGGAPAPHPCRCSLRRQLARGAEPWRGPPASSACLVLACSAGSGRPVSIPQNPTVNPTAQLFHLLTHQRLTLQPNARTRPRSCTVSHPAQPAYRGCTPSPSSLPPPPAVRHTTGEHDWRPHNGGPTPSFVYRQQCVLYRRTEGTGTGDW
jgi:hypothetical protein